MKKSIKYLFVFSSLFMWGIVIIIIINVRNIEPLDPLQQADQYIERYDIELEYTRTVEHEGSSIVVLYTTIESQDSNFSVIFKNGKYSRDTYYNDVLAGNNTFNRISNEYYFEYLSPEITGQELVGYFYNSNIISNVLEIQFENFDDMVLQISDLEVDKQYDISELANKYGVIAYMETLDQLSAKDIAALFIEKKEELDALNVPYQAIVIYIDKYAIGIKKDAINESTLENYISQTYNIE